MPEITLVKILNAGGKVRLSGLSDSDVTFPSWKRNLYARSKNLEFQAAQ